MGSQLWGIVVWGRATREIQVWGRQVWGTQLCEAGCGVSRRRPG